MPTRRALYRASLLAVAAATTTALTVPAAAAPAVTDPSLTVSPAKQTVTSGQAASWKVSVKGASSVKITFGDGSDPVSHKAGTVTHTYAECTAHSKTDTQHFSASNSAGTVSVTTTVVISYSGPLCS